ncbi:MAG: ATP-binding protein [Bacteroidia bacterium]
MKNKNKRINFLFFKFLSKTKIKISVEDNGPGIAPEYHEKIFEIFQAIHDRNISDSTGIGLSIVKKIIEENGGKIWVESFPGKGTTFKFTFPTVQKPANLLPDVTRAANL